MIGIVGLKEIQVRSRLTTFVVLGTRLIPCKVWCFSYVVRKWCLREAGRQLGFGSVREAIPLDPSLTEDRRLIDGRLGNWMTDSVGWLAATVSYAA